MSAATNRGRGFGIAGIVMSVLGLILGIIAYTSFISPVTECADKNRYPDQASQERCIQDKLPMLRSAEPTP
ncbi:hypothetical protein D5H75_22065 [Bailinhaonella thermotolerans]|uniref:Uncharacterized protein n=1 Tax=Bailinhaonella thermotolerans TaxID=1070861 RepID=A0A3A4APK8_9ACTN|nr:hypothetical protein D5H75_22065 [Bailinhaonella thermotolerans]